jgi:hypothetical protein
MNGRRVSVMLSSTDAAAVLRGAEICERHGIDGVWVGALNTAAPSTATLFTILGAVSARTSDIRLGAIFGLGAGNPLHVAEDIGVVDQASGGRLELAVVNDGSDGWIERVATLLSGWSTWPYPVPDAVVVTPRPAQPFVPRLLVRADASAAERVHAGVMLAASDVDVITSPVSIPRVAVCLPIADCRSLLRQPAAAFGDAVVAVRQRLDIVGADEIVLELAAGDPAFEAVVERVAVVLGPAMRCVASDIGWLVPDAEAWRSGPR